MQSVDKSPETHSIWIDLRPNLIILFVVFEGELGILKIRFTQFCWCWSVTFYNFFCLNQDWLECFDRNATCYTKVEPAVTTTGRTWFSYIIFSCTKGYNSISTKWRSYRIVVVFLSLESASKQLKFLNAMKQNSHYCPLTYPLIGFLTAS